MNDLAGCGADAHVVVGDLDRPELDDAARHHLERVLRLRPGRPVSLGDGAGGWRLARLERGGRLTFEGEVRRDARAVPAITIAFALTKGDRPDLVVQKLTELGVDEIVLFAAHRSVVRWDGERAVHHLERLRRVVDAAVGQSRRTWSPTVNYSGTVTPLLERPGLVRAERGGSPPSLSRPVVLIGPEGGWDDLDAVVGVPSVGFGENVLRAETAAIAAGAALSVLRLFPT